MPTASDLVTDLPADFEVFGQAVATSLADLLGGTTGQVLSKASNTNMDFTWVNQDDSNAIQNAIVDAKGDLIAATAADTPARLAVGTNGQVLTADSTAATGLAWASPSSGSSYAGASAYRSTSQTLTANAYTAILWNAEHWDTNAFHDNSTNASRFTVPSGKAGYYSYKFNLGVGAISGDVYYHIRVNGTNKWNYSWDLNSPTNIQASATVYMAVGDYLELFVYHTSAISTAADTEALCSFDYLGA
jgi:hypothetical protein